MSLAEETRSGAQLSDFGMIGLAVMGANLALNVADHGFTVAVWNREPEAIDSFTGEHNASGKFTGAHSLEDFVRALKRPRRIMMMIKAGAPVDEMIERLKPLLDAGDVIIDGGNSWFKDTQRRAQNLEAAKINFIGSGVSGGESGARHGPSMMPGGRAEAYEEVRAIFEAIAAKTEWGACVTHVGADGAGHFVKMVHNGIEYGDMQLIAEAYDMMRRLLGMNAEEMADVFDEWNRGDLESYLIEITAQILRVKDPETGQPLVDLVLDKAGQKGTGKWTSDIALELGISIPTIDAAVASRNLSAHKAERVEAGKEIKGPNADAKFTGDKKEFIAAIHDALYASKICSYAQGMSLIHEGSKNWNWNINLGETARIWKGGCIIRAKFLGKIKEAYDRRPDLSNLLLDSEFNNYMQGAQSNWRRAVTTAMQAGLPVSGMAASIGYFDTYRTAELPLNLTQAQRDFFGSHTYERADKPGQAAVHTEWEQLLEGQSKQA